MRVLILTSSLNGSASCYLPQLSELADSYEIVGIVRTCGISAPRSRRRLRKLQKTARIGVLGAVNGLRIRGWFRPTNTENLEDLCERLSIPFHEEAYTASDETRSTFRAMNADLGLSLGNGYIPPSVYEIPRLGMLNVHTEVLPKYRGAQSVIWPIYEQDYNTGFTIHQINKKIDGGRIFYSESRPIKFFSSLQRTVESNLAETRRRVPLALADIIRDFDGRAGHTQEGLARSYTTPSIWQFRRMVKHNRLMFRTSQTQEDRRIDRTWKKK